MGQIAACVMVKNEARDIAEWLAYHSLLGFDPLIVFDNGSTDGTGSVLRAAARRLDVRIIEWRRADEKAQTGAYEHACREVGRDCEWIAFFDADEFLVLHQHASVREFLAGLDQFAAVAINWAIFGSSGHEDFHTGLVTETFTRRSAADFVANRHVKSIVRPGNVIDCPNPHYFRIRGAYGDGAGKPMSWAPALHGQDLPGGVSAEPADFSIGQLNHYFTRSRAHWLEKVRRGYPEGIPPRQAQEFAIYDRNEVEDRTAAGRADAVRALMAEFAAAPGHQPVVHVLTQGNMANQMVQYVVAARLASLVPGCRVSHVDLPDWGIHHPTLPSTGGSEILVQGQEIDIAGLAGRMRAGEIERVNLLAFGQWMANFPSREDCARIFPADPQYQGYGPDKLVCIIRGGEVLDARHPDYTLLPVRFYAELAQRTGLGLVFMGQIEDNAYCDELRRAFPGAVFRPSEGPLADFQVFRNSANLVPAVSTFAWLAAWLSGARRIILPVTGLYHPVQTPDIDLLPLADPRYSFVLFPINYSVPVSAFRGAHAAIDGLWRQMRPEAIGALRSGPRWPRRASTAAPLLDEAFYLSTYADVASVVAEGHITALEHYYNHGHAERRRAFALDRRWYSVAYPMAAFEVGQGDYADFEHHYVEIGRARGYRPLPPARA